MKSRKAAVVREIMRFERRGRVELPIYSASVSAGFPSPADDYIDRKLDLNELLVKHPAATFFVRVEGDSMKGAGIHHGDLLVVDRALEPEDKKIVIAVLNGELTVKRIRKRQDRLFLEPENDKFQPLEIKPDAAFEIWGVVTAVVHAL